MLEALAITAPADEWVRPLQLALWPHAHIGRQVVGPLILTATWDACLLPNSSVANGSCALLSVVTFLNCCTEMIGRHFTCAVHDHIECVGFGDSPQAVVAKVPSSSCAHFAVVCIPHA
jgi:hypothetical protein